MERSSLTAPRRSGDNPRVKVGGKASRGRKSTSVGNRFLAISAQERVP